MSRTKTKPKPKTKQLPGDLMEAEIEKYTMGYPFTMAVDSHSIGLTPDLEYENETATMMQIFDCDGSVPRQLMRECRRIAGIYIDLEKLIRARLELELDIKTGKAGAA